MDKAQFISNSLKSAILVSYGVIDQFIEVRFDHREYKFIVVNIDCKISSNISQLNRLVSELAVDSNEVGSLPFFIVLNLKNVIDVEFGFECVLIHFDNGTNLRFDLSKEESNVAISFFNRHDESSKGFEILNNGIFD